MYDCIKVLGQICLVVCLVVCISGVAVGDTVTWDDGGTGNNWFNPQNWDTDAIPVEDDDVIDSLDGTISYGSGTDPEIATFFASGGVNELNIEPNSTLTIKQDMTFTGLSSPGSPGGYLVNVLGGGGLSARVNIGDIDNPNAGTAGFNWFVDGGSPLFIPIVDVRGTIGDGLWTVEGIVTAGAINSSSPWVIQNGGSVTADDYLGITDWSIGDVGGGQFDGTVTVDNFMRIESATVYHGGKIDATDGTANVLPRVQVKGILEIRESALTSGGALNVDRLTILGSGELTLIDGVISNIQVFVAENYARVASPGKITYGDGRNRIFCDGYPSAAVPLPLTFAGSASRIMRKAGSISPHLRLESGMDIDIFTDVSNGLGREWDTTAVELHLVTDNWPTTDPALEVIAPDNCNVMFVNAGGGPFPPNPCLKYWEDLSVVNTSADLTDVRSNYNDPTGVDDGAVYVVHHVTLTGGDSFTFDLGDNAIYWGESYSPGSMVVIGRVTQLITTTYGDFDGDCDVDADDLAQFDAVERGPNIVTCFPLADADGDCDVDAADRVIFDQNFGNTAACWYDGGYHNTPPGDLVLDPDCPAPPTSCLVP